jgi:hypothetical protein
LEARGDRVSVRALNARLRDSRRKRPPLIFIDCQHITLFRVAALASATPHSQSSRPHQLVAFNVAGADLHAQSRFDRCLGLLSVVESAGGRVTCLTTTVPTQTEFSSLAHQLHRFIIQHLNFTAVMLMLLLLAFGCELQPTFLLQRGALSKQRNVRRPP